MHLRKGVLADEEPGLKEVPATMLESDMSPCISQGPRRTCHVIDVAFKVNAWHLVHSSVDSNT